MQFTEAQDKVAKISNDLERSVAEMLLNMGFEYFDSNSIIENSNSQRVGEIDLLFGFEDYLLIVEVSKDKHTSAKKIAFFTKWAERANLELVRKKYDLRPRKVIRIYFDLGTSTPENPSAETLRITQKGSMNKIAYLDDYGYFMSYLKKIGSWSKNDFLDWLEFLDEDTTKTIDAIQFYIGDVPAFCFVERVDNLLKTCYVSRRKTKDLGYQRALKQTRVVQISQNIKKGASLSFPNSILISVPHLTNGIALPEDCPKVVKIHFPTSYNKCRIIDGQHRLFGFSAVSTELRKMHSLPVIALQDYNRKKEIKTFVDINSKQQRIDSNLILLLKADLDWEQGTKEFKEKIAVGVAEQLNSSYFKNRIYFGMADEYKGSKITLSTLVTAMVNNNQVLEDVKKTHSKIAEVFKLIQQVIPKYSFNDGAYFSQNQGIRVLFRLLYLIQRNYSSNTVQVSKEEFFGDLGTIFDDDLIANLREDYGLGGVNASVKRIIEKVQERYPDKYGDIKTSLTLLRK